MPDEQAVQERVAVFVDYRTALSRPFPWSRLSCGSNTSIVRIAVYRLRLPNQCRSPCDG